MAKGKIDYDTVVAATGGDALAAGAVLDYFNDFMDGLCTGFYTDADGFWDYGIDLSMKSFMQAKLWQLSLRTCHLSNFQLLSPLPVSSGC